MIPALHGDLTSVLIVLPSWVGDSVMATPVFRAVRHAAPKARIIGLARPGMQELLAGTPWFDEWINAHKGGPFHPLAISRRIRAAHPEAALLLPNSFRTALTVRLARVPIRAGYARDGRRWLLTHPFDVEKSIGPVPTLGYYARLAEETLGVERIDRHMELGVTEHESRAAAELLGDLAGRPGAPGGFVLLNPGANKIEKRWPARRFAAVADALRDSSGASVAVTGSPGEREVIEAVVQAAKSPIVNLAARGITLASLKAVIRQAALLITNDTGPRHMAAALGTPIVTLFGPTDHRWTTIGFERERIIVSEPFLPENQIADENAGLCAIERISVGDVLAAAHQLLGSQMQQVGAGSTPGRSAT